MPLGRASFTYNDYDGDTAVHAFNTAPLTAANLAAQTALKDTYQTALQNIILGEPIKNTLSIDEVNNTSNVRASDPQAQRGKKWLVSYHDVSQYLDAPTNTVENPNYLKAGSYEIPIADLEARGSNLEVIYTKDQQAAFADDAYELSIEAYVDAAEDFVKSPTGGIIEIDEIRAVSRNLD